MAIIPTPEVQQAASPNYFAALSQQESSNNPYADSGPAKGLYQFTVPTWNALIASHPELGLKESDIWSPGKQALAIRAFTQDNARVLQQHGFQPTQANLYMLHFLGAGAGPKFLAETRQN